MPTKRPKGPAIPITKAWKAAVRAELERRGWSQTELAAKVGVHPSAITVLLRETTATTRVAAQISQLLDVPLPTPPPEGSEDATLLRIGQQLRALNPEGYLRIRKLMERAVGVETDLSKEVGKLEEDLGPKKSE